MNVELRRARALRALVLVAVLSILLMSSMLTGSVGGDAGAAEDSGTDAARIGDTGYGSLQEAVSAADGATVVLLRDVSEDITVSGSITLDLNGHKLTNVAGDTITVLLGASLTVTDSTQGAGGRVGSVDNTTDGTACIFNNGTVVHERGTFIRSAEAGSGDDSNGNSYYNIVNHGTMTIGDGASVEQNGTHSSLIENGYYSYAGDDARSSHIDGTNAANPTLTITGGTFAGGLNTVKNDDGAVVTIDGGSFSTSAQHALFNVNIATVNGGTFASPGYPLYNCSYEGGQDQGLLTINSGTFSHGTGYADVYDASTTADGKVTISQGVHAAVYSVGQAAVDADARLNTSVYGDLEGVLAFCTDPSATYALTLLRDVSGAFSIGAVVTISGNGHSLALTGDSLIGGIIISGDLAVDGKGFSLTTSAERGIYISDASESSTISVKDLVLVNGRTERNSDGVATSYGIVDWMAGAGGSSTAVGNGYALTLDRLVIRGYDSKGVYIGAAVSLDIEGCAFENAAKTWYIPSKYRTGGTVDSTDDIRNGGWDVTGGDFALQVRNFAAGAEITIKDCTFSGENGRLSSIMVTQYTAQVSKLSVSGCTFDRSHSTSLGDVSIGKALGKDGTNAGNIANQAIASSELIAGKGGMTVVYRGDDRIDDPETSDPKAFLAGMEANALAGFDATPLRLYLSENASVSVEGVWTGSQGSTVSISVEGGAGTEGAVRSGESLKGALSLESIVVKEGASIDSTVSSGTSGAVAFSAVGGSGGMTVSYSSDGFSWSGSYTGMDSLSVTGAVVLAMGSVNADIELASAGSSVIFQKDSVYNGTISYGGSSASFSGVSMGGDTSVSAGSVGLAGTFASATEGTMAISGEGTISGTVQGVSVNIAPGASVTVPEGRSLVVRDAALAVSEGATLTLDGTLVAVDDSSVDNAGTVDVKGTFRATVANTGKVTASVHADISRSTIAGSGTVEQVRPTVSIGQPSYTVTVGWKVEVPVTVTEGADLLLIVTDSEGRVVDAGWISYSDGTISAGPTAAGIYTVTATPYIAENVGQAASFTLTSVDPEPEPEPDDDDDDNTALYIGIAVLVIVVIAIAAVMHLRHR